MQILKGHNEIKSSFMRPIITIGNFDGVHIGHKKIIQELLLRAQSERGTSIVYTFKPHPQMIVSKQKNIELLTTYNERAELLQKMGIDILIEEPFDRKFSTIKPEKFFSDILLKRLGARALYVGYDFGFGKGRTGTIDLLETLCRNKKVDFHIFEPEYVGDEVSSSSSIRDYLKKGKIKSANRLLGYEFFYRGLVKRGSQRGKKLGFPTANILVSEEKILIKAGVYVTRAVFGKKIYHSVTNVGYRPTFSQGQSVPPSIETHILNFDQNIYGKTLEIHFIKRLRDEMRFENANNLIQQIIIDVQSAKKYLVGK